MSKMAKVFIVTHGDYSDYHIVGVFSTQEKAQEAIDSGAARGDIEEHDLDPTTTKYGILEQGWRQWHLDFNKEGDIVSIYEQNKQSSYDELEGNNGQLYWSIKAHPMYQKYEPRFHIHIRLFAKDKDHAIKSAIDKRRMVLSNVKLWATTYHNTENFYVKKDEE